MPSTAPWEQVVVVSPERNPIGLLLLQAFYNSTPQGAPLSSCRKYSQYYSDLRGTWRDMQVGHLGLSPHEPRAAWATFWRLNGMGWAELRESGRWESDKALRVYLDALFR